jgi:predicted outer membrane repeat protein
MLNLINYSYYFFFFYYYYLLLVLLLCTCYRTVYHSTKSEYYRSTNHNTHQSTFAFGCDGVISAFDSIMTTSNGTFMFRNNMAIIYGGVLYAVNSIMELTNWQFLNNMAGDRGGGMLVVDSNLYLRTWNDSNQSPITIQGNHATALGGFVTAFYSTVTIEHYHFKNNSARSGGVFFIVNTSLALIGSSNHTIPIVFENNIANFSGGVIFARENSIITALHQSCHFINNKARVDGGAITSFDSTVTLTNSDNPKFPIEFRNNEAQEVCHLLFSFFA